MALNQEKFINFSKITQKWKFKRKSGKNLVVFFRLIALVSSMIRNICSLGYRNTWAASETFWYNIVVHLGNSGTQGDNLIYKHSAILASTIP